MFSKKGEPSNQNELEQVIHEASENDVIDEDTEDMIQGIFDINRLRVSDVMIPSSDIVAINLNATLEEAARKRVDMDGDGRIGVLDAVEILTIYAKKAAGQQEIE